MADTVSIKFKPPKKIPQGSVLKEKKLTCKEINDNLDASNILLDYFSDDDGIDKLITFDIEEDKLITEDEEFTDLLEECIFWTYEDVKIKKLGPISKEIKVTVYLPKEIILKKTDARKREEEEEESDSMESENESFKRFVQNLSLRLSDEYDISNQEVLELAENLQKQYSPEHFEKMLNKAAEWRIERLKYRRKHRKEINPKTKRYHRTRTTYEVEMRKRSYQETKSDSISQEEWERRFEERLRERLVKAVEKSQIQIGKRNLTEAYTLVEKQSNEILNKLSAKSKIKIRPNLVKSKRSEIHDLSSSISLSFLNEIMRGASHELATPRGYNNVYDTDDLFLPPEGSGSISGNSKTKKRTYVRTVFLTEAKISKAKRFNRLYGCSIAATFFQLLVSNTPIDEDYVYTEVYKRKVKKNKNVKIVTGKGMDTKPRTPQEIARDIIGDGEIITYKRERKHRADNKQVRADWVLTFRNKNFKAWDSEQEIYSDSIPIDAYMNPEWFERKGDIESINSIAQFLLDNTDEDNFDYAFVYNNLNPRWEILEKGGYTSSSDARVGSRYGLPHGSKNGYSYQAPMGFVRLIEAYWNMTLDSGRWAGYASKFINSVKHSSIDIDVANHDFVSSLDIYARNEPSSFSEYEVDVKR